MFSSIVHVVLRNRSGASNISTRRFPNHYGRNKAKNASNEDDLHRILINSPPHPYTLLEAHEWQSRTGVGDMVFKAPGSNRYLVVEAKLLRNGVQKKWEKAQEQAGRYGRDWKHENPSAFVKYATFTNRDGLLPQGELR